MVLNQKNVPRFIVDAMLGRIARWLRILGFDTIYNPQFSDSSLLAHALHEQRVLLTRDRSLVQRAVKLGIRVLALPENGLEENLQYILKTLRITPEQFNVWSRCVECNTNLVQIQKEHVRNIVPEFVYKHHHIFYQCPSCMKIFWEGTHYKKMKNMVNRIHRFIK